MKRDRIKRKAHRVFLRINGEERSIMGWLNHPDCHLSERQLRRRINAYESGHMQMSIHDLVFRKARAREVKPRLAIVRVTPSDAKSDFGINDPEMKRAVCGSWR